MKQQTFSDVEYSNRKKKTKREGFLDIMDETIPWNEWAALVEPYYPKGKRGRPPVKLETILRLKLGVRLKDSPQNQAPFFTVSLHHVVNQCFPSLQSHIGDSINFPYPIQNFTYRFVYLLFFVSSTLSCEML